MRVSVVYEDKHIIAVNKPSGLVVHPDGRTDEEALTDWVVARYPEIRGVGEPLVLQDDTIVDRPGIVHRLDRETSGIMVVAKTEESFKHLKQQFKKRRVKKVYRAFIYGSPKLKEGIIDRKIGKSAKDFRLWSAQRGARGKLRDAVTEYTILKEAKEVSYVEARPQTGRTHQIRVHFKAIHHPVVCDKLYAPNHDCMLGFDRLALHALSLSFNDTEGKRLTLKTEEPNIFKEAEKNLRAL